ncbi:hypothetical protein BK127_06025 [Paenibacillus sp. FSL H7-0331]|nr:hypothetical protein BK127_06025 [Paenibacillus sp. FSL H7-0331]
MISPEARYFILANKMKPKKLFIRGNRILAIEKILEYLIYFLVWPSFFVLALALFRVQLKQYIIPIIVSTCIMTPVAALLQSSEIIYLLTIIQPLAFLFCLMVVFRFKFFHSIMMIGLVFVYSISAEFVYNMIVAQFNYQHFLHILRDEYIMQGFWVSFINYMTTYLIIRSRWGFTFISTRNSKIHSSAMIIQNKLYLSVLIFLASFSMISLSVYLWKDMFLFIFTSTSTILAFVLHYSYKREFHD